MEQYFNLINWDSAVDIIKALAAIGVGSGLMSLLVSALVGSTWPSQAKALVAFLMCIIGAGVPIAISGVELTNLALVLPLLWLGTQAFYRLWFKPTGIAPWIETLFFNTKTEPFPSSHRPGELALRRRLVTWFEGRTFTHAALGAGPDHNASHGRRGSPLERSH
jgi:hypothetical protein